MARFTESGSDSDLLLGRRLHQIFASLSEILQEIALTGQHIPTVEQRILHAYLAQLQGKDENKALNVPDERSAHTIDLACFWAAKNMCIALSTGDAGLPWLHASESQTRVQQARILAEGEQSTRGSPTPCRIQIDNPTRLSLYCIPLLGNEDITIEAMYDTGAFATVLRLSIAMRTGSEIREVIPPLALATMNGQPLLSKHFVCLDVCLPCCQPDNFCEIKFFLLEDKDLPFKDAYVNEQDGRKCGHTSLRVDNLS